MRPWHLAVLIYAASLCAEVRTFSIPKASLERWAGRVTVEMDDVKIGGNSKVHSVASDCEIHFGAFSINYTGTPSGLVLEPMNACEAPFPGKTKFVKNDWMKFATSIKGKTVKIGGVPRIWPEHLGDPDDPSGGPPSNPNHAVEFHPLTKVTLGSKTSDFSRTVYAPDGFTGGVSASTAEKILTDTDIAVSHADGVVKVDFDSGRIGNFTTFELRIRRLDIDEVPGGHRMKGKVILSRTRMPDVTIITVKGSRVDDQIIAFRKSKKTRMEIEGLVLFSLDPKALLDKVNAGGGQVEDPLQLILYGDIDDEEQ